LRNDRRAQEELYKRFYPAVMALCLRYVRDSHDAVEVVNDSYLKVFRHLDRYDATKGAFYTWIKTIVINTALDSLRRQKAIRDKEMLPDQEEEPGIDNDALAKMSGDELLNAIFQLPVTTRLVFNLYNIDGYSHREIGHLLSISEGTSRWHLNDGRRQLKVIIHLMNSRV
jgi:RNA polymerase sigma-70 factor (ECF subfamily)